MVGQLNLVTFFLDKRTNIFNIFPAQGHLRDIENLIQISEMMVITLEPIFDFLVTSFYTIWH